MSAFVIKHDTQRYGDETGGLERFGPRVEVSGVTAEQAEAIADAMSGYSDAGLTDQYIVESAENTPEIAIAEYSRLTQEEFSNRVLSPEFAAEVDAAMTGGPIPIVREFGRRMDEAAKSGNSFLPAAAASLQPCEPSGDVLHSARVLALLTIFPLGKFPDVSEEDRYAAALSIARFVQSHLNAERERCKKIANAWDAQYDAHWPIPSANAVASGIVKQIMSGEPAPNTEPMTEFEARLRSGK